MGLAAKFVIPGVLFILTLVFGFWLSRSGKPYNGLIFNIHKLIALAAVIVTAIRAFNALKIVEAQPILIVLLIVIGLCAVALFVTGALMSANKATGRASADDPQDRAAAGGPRRVRDALSARRGGVMRQANALGLLRPAVALAAATAGFVLFMLPARRALRGSGPVALDGIVTLDDAVAACRRSGLDGWDLVAYAQRLVYRKFTFYSCRNLWDTPAAAFRRGMGYCTQYNLALKQILDRLGFDVRAVFSLRVRVAEDPDWTMGHTWLRVRDGRRGAGRVRRAGRQPARAGQLHGAGAGLARKRLRPGPHAPGHDRLLRLPGVAGAAHRPAAAGVDVRGTVEWIYAYANLSHETLHPPALGPKLCAARADRAAERGSLCGPQADPHLCPRRLWQNHAGQRMGLGKDEGGRRKAAVKKKIFILHPSAFILPKLPGCRWTQGITTPHAF